MFTQTVTPNPHIPCRPGWCLQYIQNTYGAPALEPTAAAAWNNAKNKHRDWDFPAGVWIPVWFELDGEPAGHVALRAPDGSVYSTSDDSTIPHHHPSMTDLLAYYWRRPLTYLGWTEDIETLTIITPAEITPTPDQEDDAMTAAEVLDLKMFFQNELERRKLAIVTEIQTSLTEAVYELKVFSQTDSENRHIATRDEVDRRVDALQAELDAKLARLDSFTLTAKS